MFLATIERLEPEIKEEHEIGVLESLHRDVLPIYKENTAGSAKLIFMFDEALQEHKNGNSSDYCKAFIDWMLHWNIAERWIRDAAGSTLSGWSNEWQEEYTGLYRGHEYEWQQSLADDHGSFSEESQLSIEKLLHGVSPRYGFSYDPFGVSRREVEERFNEWQSKVKNRFVAFWMHKTMKRKREGGSGRKRQDSCSNSSGSCVGKYKAGGVRDL
jgi:hypothetical protein